MVKKILIVLLLHLMQRQYPDISTIIDNYGVAIRAGQHCCGPLPDLLGINESRASIAMYTKSARH